MAQRKQYNPQLSDESQKPCVETVIHNCKPFVFIEFCTYDIKTHKKIDSKVIDGVLLFKGRPICYVELEQKRKDRKGNCNR